MELVRFELTKPSECKSDALPTELQPLIKRQRGLEPPAISSAKICSTS